MSSFRKHTGNTASRRYFHFPHSLFVLHIRKTALSGGFSLFLHLLEYLVLSGGGVEFLELNLALYLLLVLAREDHVPGRALELYKMVL